jgi:hypothetical protein
LRPEKVRIVRPNLAACRDNLAPAECRKVASLQKFFAVDYGFVQHYPLEKCSTCRRATVSQMSPPGKYWFPPIRGKAGANPMTEVAFHHRASLRPPLLATSLAALQPTKILDQLRERIRLLNCS